ncbi:flavonoid O-methyltransferase-like protein Os11g0303600 [Hordeum vulgare subsp. vulgare]|uniref:O-methyltransferase ZRP4 n=1 Tax=Hordeum vulgare subsp. vulgare TaxID=112509 RepID=A0A8I6YE64_HORVV|nr:flavonoid O-methyltransferase-like protein Os11g0303600 [Hordeum vulgare subsp. vulgare]
MATQAQQLAVPTEAELLQGQADLWRHSLYYMTSMAFQCAVKLGIPTTIHSLGGAASLPDLVAALSLPPAKLPYLRRIMRLLATSGVFAADSAAADVVATYRLTPLSWLLLDGVAVDGHPSQTSLVLAATSRHCLEAAMGLSDWFKKDVAASPFQDLHGVTLFDGTMAEQDPEVDAVFNDALASHDNSGFLAVLRECGGTLFQGLESLTDCCGGDGTTARAIVEAFPQIKCTVLDLPRVIDNVPADGVVNYVAGDMFNSVPFAQAVLIKLVLHHWSDEDCVRILAQCKKAIPPREEGGKVIVIDIVVDSSSGPTHEAELLMDVAMMVMTNGRQRDETDWSEIFIKAGFSDYKVVKKLGARGVFEVYP